MNYLTLKIKIGMSYRGRVLLELSSKSMSPEEKIGPNTDLLPSEIVFFFLFSFFSL